MKYLIVIGDGMADTPQAALCARTPLAYAETPCLDRLAAGGQCGQTCLIPPGCAPGSLPALLTLLGCPPEACACGRAALEALAQGPLAPDASAVRCNLVHLENGLLAAHDGGGVTEEQAEALFDGLRTVFTDDRHTLLSGAGYRGLLVRRGFAGVGAAAPETLIGQRAETFLPQDDPDLVRLFQQAQACLQTHPVNRARAACGQPEVNGVWFWGGGPTPSLPDFRQQTGLRAGVVTGVPLLRGIARGMGMELLPVRGADGTLHTNWEGKAFAAYDGLTRGGLDLVLVHAEAPDEAGHAGDVPEKVAAVEYLSERLLARLTGWLDEDGIAYRLLVLADHPTPVALRRHTADPVPWLLYDSTARRTGGGRYEEGAVGPEIAGGELLARLIQEEV